MRRKAKKYLYSRNWYWIPLTSLAVIFLGYVAPQHAQAAAKAENANKLMVVDCLLPGKVRRVGGVMTYLSPRRPVKTTESDCKIRGGEYTSFDRANYATALKIWLPEAEQGDPRAQTYVGEIFEKGLGTVSDYQAAATWYLRAADQGYSPAQINLGQLYEKGLGVEPDMQAALNWYRRASGLEDDDLQWASSVRVTLEAKDRQIQDLEKRTQRSEEEIAALRGQLGTLQSELGQRQIELDLARSRRDEISRQLAQQESVIQSGSSEARERANQELAQKEGRLDARRAELDKLASDLEKQAAMLTDKQRESAQQNTELESRLLTRQAEAERLRHRLDGLNKDLDLARSELSESASQDMPQLARLQAVESERTELQSALADSDEQVSTLVAELETARGNLDETATDYARTINELEQRKALYEFDTDRLKRERDRLAKQTDVDMAEIKRLRTELKEQEAQYTDQIESLSTRYSESQSRVAEVEKELDEMATADPVIEVAQLPPPSIELFEPPVSLTRGAYVANVAEKMDKREIIGKVSAPAGLVRFNVNDEPVDPDNEGLFKHWVPLTGGRTSVSMAVVDRQGQRVAFDFDLFRRLEEEKKKSSKFIKGLGKYHALVIGNANYANFPSLRTPANDAKKVAEILKKQYGYKTRLLLDANRYDIISALNEYRKDLTKKDNLLVYYAGHGEIDNVNSQGYWLPVDSEKDNTANWISTRNISEILNIMMAKHVMIVADSCYSGAMSRSAMARLQSGKTYDEWVKWFKKVSKMRTRMVLSSGGEEPVNDGGGGEHSLFAQAFMDALMENDQVLDGYRLYLRISELTTERIESQNLEIPQSPQYAPIKFTGHEAGEFIFQRS
jgi:TPR repeat protein